jgi:SAM-dependent methyltransferase
MLDGKGRLSSSYRALVAASCHEFNDRYPVRVQRYLNNLTNYEYAATINEWVGDARDVLIVGDAGGRDYYTLKTPERRVVVLDVAPQGEIDRLVLGDVSLGIPFHAGAFDAVVMAEVIEHLIYDTTALEEVWRVLRPEGTLVLTTPIGNDAPDYHVRVYTPRTIERLLRHTGFSVADLMVKGGGFAAIDASLGGAALKHAVQYLLLTTRGRTSYRHWNESLRCADLWISRRLPLLHRLSRHYGIFLRALKGTPQRTARALNASEFAYRY